jgi:hypothetical protein
VYGNPDFAKLIDNISPPLVVQVSAKTRTTLKELLAVSLSLCL